MVLRLSSQVVIKRLMPVLLHVLPILNHTSLDNVVGLVSVGVLKCLIPNIEVIVVKLEL